MFGGSKPPSPSPVITPDTGMDEAQKKEQRERERLRRISQGNRSGALSGSRASLLEDAATVARSSLLGS